MWSEPRPSPPPHLAAPCAALQERLARVAAEGRARALVVHGPPSAPLRDLGRWAVESALARGGDGLVACHHALERPDDGLAGALVHELGLDGPEWGGGAALAEALTRLAPEDEDDAWGLAAMVHPELLDVDSSPDQRVALLLRLLERRATQHPFVLVLEDAEWGHETLALVRRALARQTERATPILILLCLASVPDPSPELPAPLDLAAVREALRPEGGAWEIELPPGPVVDALAAASGPEAADVLLRLALLNGRAAGREWAAFSPPGADGQATMAGLVARGLVEPWRGGWALRPGVRVEAEASPALHAALAEALTRPGGAGATSERLVGHLMASGQLEAARARLLAAAMARCRAGRFEWAERLLDRHDELAVRLGLGAAHPGRLAGLLERANLLRVTGRLQQAMTIAEGAVSDAGQADELTLAQALRVLAVIATEVDELDRAEALLTRARVIHEAAGPSEGHALVLRDLSNLADRRGQLDEAEAWGRRSLTMFEALGLERQAAGTLSRLALAQRQQGRLDEALDAYLLAERRSRALHYLHGLSSALRGRAATLRALGRIDESVRVLGEASEVMERMGNELGLAHCRNGLAEAARRRGDLATAEQEYRRALEIFERLGSGQAIYPRINLGLVLLGRGLTRQAREQLEASRGRLEATGRPGMLGAVLVTLLPCLVAEREWTAWEDLYHRAVSLLSDTRVVDEDIAWAAELSGDWSEVGAKRSVDLGRAARSYELALQQWQGLGRGADVARVTQRLVELARAGSPIPLGPFDLERCEGAGGTGEVWVGRHRVQGVAVAVKVLTSAVAREPEVLEAFGAEVRAVAGLDHPNVIIVLDHGRVPLAASAMSEGRLVAESPYLAMEFCDAGTLSALCGLSPWEECRRVLLSLLDALAHAHARGVVHRDLKPGNVLLERHSGERPVVKLSDFGIAHALRGAPGRRLVVGTPEYMAPEQLRGDWRTYGAWTDLYALGCVAWALVSGRPPFSGKSPEALAQAHWLQDPPPLRPQIPVPAGFEAWVRRLLAKRPQDRYRRAADAAWGLSALGPPDEEGFVPPEHQPTPAATVRTFVLDDLELEGAPPQPVPEAEPLVAPAQVIQPPAPANWRPLAPPPPLLALRGAGLALYGLRPIPVVGRERERDLLWASLLSVVADSQPRSVLLSGPAGFGKSRLATWLGEHAHALGLAELIRVDHRDGQPGALVRALHHHASCQGLWGAELRAQLEGWLRGRGYTDPARWEGLARLLEATADGEPLSPEEAAGLRFELRSLARERAVVLLLEATHWGADTLELLSPLLEEGDAPVLVVMTARDDLLVERPAERSALAALRARPNFDEVVVEALPQEHRITLVKALLDLEESLAQQVAARTAGNLRFAMELIRDWVDRDLLQVGPSGFHLRPGARTPLPAALHKSWVERVERAQARLGEGARLALECMACAGADQLRFAEWRDACAIARVELDHGMPERLAEEALVRRVPRGWTLVHAILRESLEQTSEEQGRAHRFRRAWAEVLRARGRSRDRARIGMLLMRSGQPEAAIEPVKEAVLGHVAHGRPDEAAGLVEVWEEALRALGVGEADPRWGELWLARAQLAWEQGYHQETERHAQRLLDTARRHRWEALVAPALRLTAMGREAVGDLDEAWSRLVDARELHRYRGEGDGVAHCMASLGSLARGMGRLEEGMEYYEEAFEEFDARGEDLPLGRVLSGMAGICLSRGDVDDAERHYEEGLRAFRRAEHRMGEAEMRNGLGEVHRYRGDVERAEQEYRAAVEVFSALGSAKALVPQLNLGLVLLQRGRFEEAEALFEQARPWVDRRGRHEHRLLLEAFLLASTDPRDRSWDERLREVGLALRDPRLAQPDLAWPLELAGERAMRLGQAKAARDLWSLARTQWERMESKEAAARVGRRLAELDGSVSSS